MATLISIIKDGYMMQLHIENETSPLKAVILGTAESCGPTPETRRGL